MPGYYKDRLTKVSDSPDPEAAFPRNADSKGFIKAFHADPGGLKALHIANDLAILLGEHFPDPSATLSLVTNLSERIIADREAGTGEDMTNQAASPIKSLQLGGPSKPVRSYGGFDRESATYGRLKPELLTKHEGKFVVVVGEELIGPFDSFQDARWEGYERFGYGPLYIKQVLAVEPVIQTSRDI